MEEKTPTTTTIENTKVLEQPIFKHIKYNKIQLPKFCRFINSDRSVVNAIDTTHYDLPTPLHTAIRYGKSAYVEALLCANANVNSTDKQLYTPLHYAVVTSHEDTLPIIKLLLTHHADYHLQNENHKTPVDLIFSRCSLSKQEILELTNDAKKTERIMTFKLEILKLFVEKFNKLFMSYTDYEGKTLLHLAVLGTNCQKAEIIKFLLSNGADAGQKDNHGQSANDLYKQKYHHDITDLIPKELLEKVQKEVGNTSSKAYETFMLWSPFLNSNQKLDDITSSSLSGEIEVLDFTKTNQK